MDRDRSESARAALEDALSARYEILNLHGQGGMGMVFCARARALEKLVAIKVLLPGALTAVARDRFRREARLAASLSHPSIVPVFEFDETGEFPYIIMEFVRGESLGRRLRHEGRLPPDATRRILLDLSDALDHAHRRGIIHRDLKPENILIAADSGRPLLADFGIAKAMDDGSHLTLSGFMIGTPEYMSPEQAAAERDIDHRSDLYSLGAIGYTMLAGRPPHQGNGVASVIGKILSEEPMPLRELVPDAPRDLLAAISRCLEKAPERRWADARALHSALSREGSEDEPVTEELRGVTGFGAFMVIVLVAAVAWAVNGWASADYVLAAVTSLAGLLVAIGFLIYARGIADHGYALRDVLRVSMWPPKWWGLWWPRALRRPGDVWECLPLSARLTRILLSLMFATILVWLVMRSALPGLAREPLRWSVIAVSVFAVLAVVTALLRWRAVGFAMQDASRLLFGPTIGVAFWNQPSVNAILITRPDAAAACGTPPDSARSMLHAIEDAAGRLSGRARESGSDAAHAARLLLDDVERLDGDIEKLARDTDPEELDRVERRMAQLNETQRDARQHLEGYARIMRGQADLLEVKRLEREDANATLRAIWTVLERLREPSGRGTPTETDLLERLRSLAAAACDRPRPGGVSPRY
jgi:serine/threonine-protein kinase